MSLTPKKRRLISADNSDDLDATLRAGSNSVSFFPSPTLAL